MRKSVNRRAMAKAVGAMLISGQYTLLASVARGETALEVVVSERDGNEATPIRTPLPLVSAEQDYGIIPNESLDQTATFNTMIEEASAAGGATIALGTSRAGPDVYRAHVVLQPGVTLWHPKAYRGYYDGSTNVTKVVIRGLGTEWVIDTPTSESGYLIGMGLDGIDVLGAPIADYAKPQASNGGAIRFRSGVAGSGVRNFSIAFFANQGILNESGTVSNNFERGFVHNVVLDRNRVGYAGAIEDHGSDAQWSYMEAGTSAETFDNGPSSLDGYCLGVLAGGVSSEWRNVVGHLSDSGWLVSGMGQRITDCRADLNYLHDWIISGTRNQFYNALAQGGGRHAANTYNAFLLTPDSNTNRLQGHGLQPGTAVYKHIVEDLTNHAYAPMRNIIDVTGYEYGTEQIKTDDWEGAVVVSHGGILRPISGATWDVTSVERIAPAYGTMETITAFTGGHNRQRIVILGDPNITIAHNDVIKTATGTNVALAANRSYAFNNWGGGYWVQEG